MTIDGASPYIDGASPYLDEQDRVAILQMLALTEDLRLDYFADEVECESTPVLWADASTSTGRGYSSRSGC